MPSIVGKRARSFGLATAILSQVFLTNAGIAQDNNVPDGPSESSAHAGNKSSIRTLLQDLSDHPLAGGVVNIEVCAKDGLEKRDCDMIEAELPLPQLNNPIGYEVQALRRELALMIEKADRDADGRPLPADLREGGADVVNSFEDFLDEQSTSFQKPDTLMRMMDLHYELIGVTQAADLAGMETIVKDLREVTLKLEEDLLTDAEKELRDAQEALKEALENGASDDEIRALNEELLEALEGFAAEKQESGDLSASEQQALEDMQDLMKALKEILEELGMSPEEFSKMMQEMMKNMMPGPSGQQGAGKPPEMSYEQMLEMWRKSIEQMQMMQKYIKELREITDEQQQVRDDTLSRALSGQSGSPADPGLPETDTLEQQQETLEDRLADTVRQMDRDGLKLGALRDAVREMGEAEGDLENSLPGEAVPDQDEALMILRRILQSMEGAMMMMMPGGGGPMSGGMPGSGAPNEMPGRDSIIDEDGKLRSSENTNEDLGLDTGDDDKRSRGVRDDILERQRKGGAGNDYLDRLLRGPEGP